MVQEFVRFGTFNDTVSNLDYTVSKDRITDSKQ
jgi:hypothetical protein